MATKLDVTAGFADVNGARLYFQTAGQGESIVFVHAGIADHRLWNEQFEHFAADYQVTRYDMRGYGQSSLQSGEFSHTRDLHALLSLLGVKRTVLVGCSMGGQYSFDFAASFPDMVKGLVMVCAIPSGLQMDYEGFADPPQYEEAVAAIKAGDLERASELEVQVWVDGLSRKPQDVDSGVRRLVNDMNLIALRNEADATDPKNTLINPTAGEDLESFDIPTLIIVGELDEPVTDAAADLMVQRMPNARKVAISDTAHVPSLERPDAFNQALADWLSTLATEE